MPRKRGSKGKPKFIGVKLKDLNRIFREDSVIRIDIGYLPLLTANESELEDLLKKAEEEEEKLDLMYVDGTRNITSKGRQLALSS